MWIIPRPLHTSDFVPDTAALSLDSTESSEICARSLFVRSKPSPARTWSQKWKRDSWTALLSGRILRPSHGQSFVTAWTSSLVATPASPSAQPVNDSEQKTQDIFGPSSQAEFAFCDPSSASLKMSKDTSASDSEKSLESWEQSVTKRRGEYSLRLKSAHRTSASASLSWPTIRASEYKDTGPIGSKSHDHMLGKGYLCAVVTQDAANWLTPQSGDVTGSTQEAVVMWANGQRPKTSDQRLRTQVAAEQLKYGQAAPANPSTDGSRQGLWPTITAHTPDMESSGPNGHAGTYLAGAVKSWGTPRACEWKGGNMTTQAAIDREVAHNNLVGQVATSPNAGKLNPRWVETLMGLPVGWVMPSCASPVTIALTNYDCSATESCLPQPSELFAF